MEKLFIKGCDLDKFLFLPKLKQYSRDAGSMTSQDAKDKTYPELLISKAVKRNKYKRLVMSLVGVNWGAFYEAAESKVPHDVKFKVMDPSDPPSYKIFSAQRLLLATVSSTFEVQFYGEHFEESDEVLVEDSQPEAFKKFLQFIYFGKKAEIAPSIKFYDMKTIQLIFDVMILADKHFVVELKEICEGLLINSSTVTEDNLFDLVQLVDANCHFASIRKEIKRKCTEYLKENIGTYGYVFIQKLNNKPTFNHEIFRDLCAGGVDEDEEVLTSPIFWTRLTPDPDGLDQMCSCGRAV